MVATPRDTVRYEDSKEFTRTGERGMSSIGLIMAKKKSHAAQPESSRADYIRIRMTSDFKDWLEAMADDCQLTVADTVTQALIHFGGERKFAPPPKR